MSIPAGLKRLQGRWKGSNKVWLMPGTPVRESDTIAEVGETAMGKFLTVHYHWADEGKPQEGFMMLSVFGDDEAEAAWTDSWHMSDRVMFCRGGVEGAGVSVRGSWAAPDGTEWGWRIVVAPAENHGFEVTMYNITPDGEEALAVRGSYRREE
jgi:hypothetical protein